MWHTFSAPWLVEAAFSLYLLARFLYSNWQRPRLSKLSPRRLVALHCTVVSAALSCDGQGQGPPPLSISRRAF
eukprot:766359-Hanusia_phi.AAC.2